jgi:hypothetical protein
MGASAAQLGVLPGCTGLTSLHLGGFTCAHLRQLLPHLTKLAQLAIFSACELDSLRFLLNGPITCTLTSLTLIKCKHPHLSVTEMQHVTALRALTELNIACCFTQPMDALSQRFFTPPSLLLPISKFVYFPAI